MSVKRVFVNLKPEEWTVLETRVKSFNKDVSAYVRSEIPKLKRKLDQNPSCIASGKGDSEQKAIYLTEDGFEMLTELCGRLHKPTATAITEFFFRPLLQP